MFRMSSQVLCEVGEELLVWFEEAPVREINRFSVDDEAWGVVAFEDVPIFADEGENLEGAWGYVR